MCGAPGSLAPGESGQGHQTCRQIYDGFDAANSSPGSNDAHLAARFVDLQTEKGCHVRILQTAETESAPLECAAQPARERYRDVDIAIEEDPASGGVPSFNVSHF
jgi:hypothetical protein